MSKILLCRTVVHELFEVIAESYGEERAEFLIGLPRSGGMKESLERLYATVAPMGCNPALFRDERGLVIFLAHRREGGNVAVNVGLALLTVLTVFLSGMALSQPERGPAWSPIAYVVGLLLPLILHEFGHWIVMRIYRTPASLPYLIPAPPLQLGFLGTFGAVINLRWLPPSSRALSLMAIAGPLAGFLAALPLAIYGIENSARVQELPEGTISLNFVPMMFLVLYGALKGGDGYLLLSSLAFSSYVVFFVTFLNLLPIAMLDGGHVVRGVAGPWAHHAASRALLISLLVLSLLNPNFLLYAIIALLIYVTSGGRHPGPAMRVEESGYVGFFVAIIYGVLFALTFPVPVRG